MDFSEAQNRVVKKWYENRILEETAKNEKLRLLQEHLTILKELKVKEKKAIDQRKQLEDQVSDRDTHETDD